MARWREDMAGVTEAWAADPALAPLVRDDAATIVWDARGRRPIWASEAVRALALALAPADSDGIDPALPAAPRLAALAGGLAPRSGARLEKLRFSPSALVPPATCACRLVALPTGEDVLVTTFVGSLPKLAQRRADPPATMPPADAPEPPPAAADPVPIEPLPEPAPDRLAAVRGRATVRFVWQADAEARFTAVSPALAEIVGPDAAAILGLRWADLADRVDDPDGAVAEHFARAETWSGRTVFWRVAGTDHAVPVDLAGIALRDGGALRGFRGFGLIRPAGLEPRSWPAGSGVVEEAEPPADAPEPEPERLAETDAAADPGPAVDRSDLPEPANDRIEPRTPVFSDMSASAGASFTGAWAASAGAIDAILDVTASPAANDARPAEDAAETPPDETEPGEPAPDPSASGEPDPRTEVLVAASAAEAVEPQVSPPAPKARIVPTPPSAGLRLSNAERNAFREIARALGARFEEEPAAEEPHAREAPVQELPARTFPDVLPADHDGVLEVSALEPTAEEPARPEDAVVTEDAPQPAILALPAAEPSATQVLARLPTGVIVHRGEALLYANRALLDLVGFEHMAALEAAGGLAWLFRGRAGLLARAEVDTPAPVPLATGGGETFAAEIRHAAVDWEGGPAGLMLVRRIPDADPSFRLKAAEAELRAREGTVRELASILDTATDGVVVVDDIGRILSLNRSAEALFGFEQNEVAGELVTALLAPESHVAALDYLEGLRANGVASLLNDGREVLGRVRQGGLIPLFMTMGRVADGLDRKFCAVLRDITAFKKTEGELIAAKRAAEAASAQKSDFLAKVSHEVRTPLNAIIGFAEVMLEERFGPVGSDRYRDYLRDIHASGAHVVSLVNDLLDLAKIEAGRMELAFTGVSLNGLVTACVGLMQPEAARSRIVLRTSMSGKLPPVVADERSVRQIILNLLSNAVKFTDAGGQVIVSTALTDRGEVAFRVRDTGIGMTPGEIEAALEPFRQLATARRGGGTGLGLPLTKALVEANRGMLQISSTKSEGTLVEVVFPPTRVLAG